jgi:hypothetical protein
MTAKNFVYPTGKTNWVKKHMYSKNSRALVTKRNQICGTSSFLSWSDVHSHAANKEWRRLLSLPTARPSQPWSASRLWGSIFPIETGTKVSIGKAKWWCKSEELIGTSAPRGKFGKRDWKFVETPFLSWPKTGFGKGFRELLETLLES